jgi:hypothetical protein
MHTIRTTLVLALVLARAAGTGAADDFPYAAYVAVDQAEVVAGPGHRFYATDRLARGTRIEIYQEEASGWLAIRPPDGAFSWTPAETIERLKDDPSLGRVKEPAAAWIGTIAEEVSEHRQQVTLKAGEMVQILGQKSVGSGDEKRKWLKIAPPAGEFRWIHLRDVGRQMPEPAVPEPEQTLEGNRDQSEREKTRDAPLAQKARELEEPRRFQVGERAIALQDIEPPGAARLDQQVAPAQFQSAAGNAKSLSPDGFVPRKRRTGESPQPLSAASAPQFRGSSPGPARQPVNASPRVATNVQPSRTQPVSLGTPGNAGLGDRQLEEQLAQIEVDLSLMLAQDKSLWNLAPLRERVETLVEQGSDPIARGQARLLLDKIKQFEAAFDVEDYGPLARPLAAAGSTQHVDERQVEAKNPLADPRYDAQGLLKPVVSRKTNKPAAPYAVVDQDGQPLCFVTPSPGLNLNRYLNKQVGLYGRRGMLEDLKKPHVVAERVIDLDRQWR